MPKEIIKRIPINRMCEHQNEHERYADGLLGHDFVDMRPEAIALRDLIDHLGEIAVIASEIEE